MTGIRDNQWQAIALAGVIATSGGPAVWAAEGQQCPTRGARQAAWAEKVFQDIPLTTQQQEQIVQCRKDFFKEQEGLKMQIKQKRQQIREELEKEHTDLKRLNRYIKELKSMINRRIDERIKQILKIKEVLSLDQFREFQNNVAEIRVRRRSLYINQEDGR